MMKNIKIICATPESSSNVDKLLIYKTLQKLNCEYHIEFENKMGLSSVYNKHIIDSNKDKILIFCHDDVIIEDMFIVEKLNEAINNFDIVGLAGMQAPITLGNINAWHLVGDKSRWSGAVAHFNRSNISERFMTTFGVMPKRVALLDGLFLAINTQKILENGFKFDEDFEFHHYDIASCIRANNLKLKLGTWPIWVTHRSGGESINTPQWVESNKKFIEKFVKG